MQTGSVAPIDFHQLAACSIAPPSETGSAWPSSIHLITSDELARELRFEGTTSAFRKFCKSAGIEPVPGRSHCYDPVAVRHRLNEIQGIGFSDEADSKGALARSNMRRNA